MPELVKKFSTIEILKKQGGCGVVGTRDRRATCHDLVAAMKKEHFLKSHCFLDLNGRLFLFFALSF